MVIFVILAILLCLVGVESVTTGCITKTNPSAACCSGDIEIDTGLSIIEVNAFKDCPSITSVVLPDGLTEIGEDAFFGDSGIIMDIVFPSSLTTIGRSAFQYCAGLTSVTFPDGLLLIDNAAFGQCGLSGSFIIPGSVQTVGNSCFHSCCDTVTSIGYYEGTFLGVNAFANGPPYPTLLTISPTGQPTGQPTSQPTKDTSFKKFFKGEIDNMGDAVLDQLGSVRGDIKGAMKAFKDLIKPRSYD